MRNRKSDGAEGKFGAGKFMPKKGGCNAVDTDFEFAVTPCMDVIVGIIRHELRGISEIVRHPSPAESVEDLEVQPFR